MARSHSPASSRGVAAARSPRTTAEPNPEPAIARGIALAIALVAGAIVFCGTLPYFFAQDDFAGLARASGLLPRLAGPWRYLSGQAYFDLMRAIAGHAPMPYHLSSLICHLGCVALLFTLLARRVSTPAALVGATFFAVHPALFTALYSVSGIGEILALLFGLWALLVAEARGRSRFLAVPLFALSLLCKESLLLLPLAAWLLTRTRPGGAVDRRGATGVAIALGTLSLVYLAYFVLSDTFGVRTALPEGAAYTVGFGSHWLWNFLSYVGWTWNIAIFTVAGFTDSVDPRVFPYALVSLVLWIAGALSRTLRERGWLVGGALYLLFLLPVLPLAHHTYHYYLYTPLVGASYCLAVLADVALARTRARHITAYALAALLALNGALLVRKIEMHPYTLPELRADPTVDRARIAEHVRDGLAIAALPRGARVRFFSPASIALGAAAESSAHDPRAETYWEANVRAALMDGLAVRVLFPAVARVEFVRTFALDDPGVHYAVYRPDGHLRVAAATQLDSLMRAFGTPR